MQKRQPSPLSIPLHYRGAVSRQIVRILRELGSLQFGTHNLGETVDESLISAAIVIGMAEGKPMTATDISHFLGYPRPTVIRKLERIAKFRRLRRKKIGARVCYLFEDLEDDRVIVVADRIMRMIASMCSQVSDLDSLDIDHGSAKG